MQEMKALAQFYDLLSPSVNIFPVIKKLAPPFHNDMTNNLVKICIYLYHMIFLRYDILCVVKDSAVPVADEAL